VNNNYYRYNGKKYCFGSKNKINREGGIDYGISGID